MPRTPGYRHYIFNTLTVLSLLLLLATVGLWVANTTASEEWFQYFGYPWNVQTDHGVIAFGWNPIRNGRPLPWDRYGFLGVEYISGPPGFIDRARMIVLPFWFLTLIFAIGPAIWLYKWNKRRALSPNACPACGYDLTGNESGQCPECGQLFSPSNGR